MTPSPRIATCKSCHARIFFAMTEKGHRIPLDEKEVMGGNIKVDRIEERDGTMHVQVLPKTGIEAMVYRFQSHFATCTNPKGHRRGR